MIPKTERGLEGYATALSKEKYSYPQIRKYFKYLGNCIKKNIYNI